MHSVLYFMKKVLHLIWFLVPLQVLLCTLHINDKFCINRPTSRIKPLCSTTTTTIFTRWNFGYKRKEKMVVVKKSIVFSMLLFFDKRNEEGKKELAKNCQNQHTPLVSLIKKSSFPSIVEQKRKPCFL